ncbi:hypothetical protein Hanom_Chr16g01462381 [Helianthus anomalus]
MNNLSKKKSGLDNDDDSDEIKLPETIDATFTSSSDEDSVQSEVIKTVVENVLKSDSDSTEDEECFLNNYLPNQSPKTTQMRNRLLSCTRCLVLISCILILNFLLKM